MISRIAFLHFFALVFLFLALFLDPIGGGVLLCSAAVFSAAAFVIGAVQDEAEKIREELALNKRI